MTKWNYIWINISPSPSIELTDTLGGSKPKFIKPLLHRKVKYEDGIIFYREN